MTDTVRTSELPTPVRELLTGRFAWFLAGRTVDLAGSSMTTVALSLAVLQATGSASDLGVVLAANIVPNLTLLLVGGTVADRMRRRRLLVAANLISGALLAGMAALLLAGAYRLPALALLSFGTGAVSAFTAPALRGIVPELVPRHDLFRANALLASSQNTVRIVGPVVASVLVATAGGGWALAVDGLSCWLAALAFLRLPGGSRPPASGQRLLRELADGWAVFRSLRWVVLMAMSFALVNAFNVGPWNVLGPEVVMGQDGAVGWGAVQAVRAAGLLVMSVVAVRLVFRRPLRDGRIWGALAGLPLLALGWSGTAWVVAPAAFVGGLGFSVAAITWESTLQEAVPQQSLSRVTAYDDLLSFLAIPLSQLLAGPLGRAAGAREVCTLCGIGCIASCLLPLLDRQVRTMES
ncbi:MFS transporter [Actinacidiphila sp. bgisy144]|uniref:MFS transporter n=1 Tax=Actinacidiphila sp. bgisy144 TaxID=3413791 RepID=UPI003EBA4242